MLAKIIHFIFKKNNVSYRFIKKINCLSLNYIINFYFNVYLTIIIKQIILNKFLEYEDLPGRDPSLEGDLIDFFLGNKD